MTSKVNLNVIPENAILICNVKNKDGYSSPYFFRVVKNDGSKINAIQLKTYEIGLRCLKFTDDKSGLELVFNNQLESFVGFKSIYKCMYIVDDYYKYEVVDNLLTPIRMIGRYKAFKLV